MHNRLNFLIPACILVVFTLGGIQYYLVQNTYRLTHDQYRLESRLKLDTMRRKDLAQGFDLAASDTLMSLANRYVNGRIARNDLLPTLNRQLVDLRKVTANWYHLMINDSLHMGNSGYQTVFREITIEHDGKLDTILNDKQSPMIYGGTAHSFGETLLVHREESRNGETQKMPLEGNHIKYSSLFVRTVSTHMAYLGNIQHIVFRRMAGILILAILLLCSVVVLFYLVFRALFRQKRMAEIRRDFANNITHELKTPLSSTQVILHTMQTSEAKESELMRETLLTALQRQQDKLQRIVDDVLDDALTETDLPQRSPLNITDFLKNYISDLFITDHEVIVNIQQQDKVLSTNSVALEKVLNNLIDNAQKYTPSGSPIHITTYSTDKNYLIEVHDKGPGIPARYRQQVFEKFFRIPEQDRHRVKGLGLGLAISRQTLRTLGGELSLVSAEGDGCNFIIQIPIT